MKTCTQIAHDCRAGSMQNMTSEWVIQSHMPLSFETVPLGGLVFTLLLMVKGVFECLFIYYYNSKTCSFLKVWKLQKVFQKHLIILSSKKTIIDIWLYVLLF